MKNTLPYKAILFLPLLLLFGNAAWTQANITGTAKDQQQAIVPFANVYLLSGTDSLKIRSGFTDDKGVFNLRNVPYGRYLLMVTSIGYLPAYTAPFDYAADRPLYDAGILTMTKDVKEMGQVTVKANKPVLEKRPDRFIMNVSASTFQSADLVDIFKALPFMDVNGEAVNINGKSNLLVLVDNIPRPKETLTSIFQTMTGQDIERIEFITNPSAQYDGSADAVINIITKKGQLQGLTGYARATYSQGIYANANGGVNITYRKKKLVLNGTLNFNGGNSLAQNYGYRVLVLQNKNIVLNETPYDVYQMQTFAGLLGMEYEIAKNHTIGAQVDGNFRHMLDGTRWYNRIEFSNAIGGKPDSVLVGLQHANSTTNVVNYSLSYKGKLDSTGKTISAAFIYTPLHKRTMNEMQFQNIEDPNGNILSRLRVIRNTNPSHSSIFVAQADVQLPSKNKLKFNAGIKANFSKLESNPYQESVTQGGDWYLIPEYSFKNAYTERILAAYAGIQNTYGKLSVNASVRAEQTMMAVEGIYEQNFTDLFPSLLLQQKFSPDYQMAFSYKRSVNRPSFIELTPYRIYLDNYTILQGNAGLKPQYTDALNLNAAIKEKLFIDADFSASKNTFTQLPMQKADTTVWQVVNLDARYYSATVTYNYKITPKWQGNFLVRGTYYQTEGVLGDEALANDGFSLNAGLNSTFSLPRDVKLDIGMNYRTPRPYGLGTTRKRSFVRLGLKGNLFDKKLQYTITASDIFKDDIFGFNLKTAKLQSRFYTYSDSRKISIGFVYNFGKKTVKAAADKKLDNEELLNRAN